MTALPWNFQSPQWVHWLSPPGEFTRLTLSTALAHKNTESPDTDSYSRRTLIYLILTLNHIYPDYDFSLLRAHHFKKEDGVEAVEEAIDGHLLEVSKVS